MRNRLSHHTTRNFTARRPAHLAAFVAALLSIHDLRATAVAADAPSDPVPVISPLLDDDTIAVAHIDASHVNLEVVFSHVGAFPALPDAQKQQIAALHLPIAEWLKQFRAAGGRDIYVVLSTLDAVPPSFLFAVPIADGANTAAIATLFQPLQLEGSMERHGFLILGSRRQLERLRAAGPSKRVFPKEAFEAVAAGDLQAFVLPSGDHRRVLSDFLSPLPLNVGKLDPKLERDIPPELLNDRSKLASLALQKGLVWIALGIKTSEPVAAKVVIGSEDNSSAQALNAWLSGLWTLAKTSAAETANSRDLATRALGQAVEPLSTLFTFTVEGNRSSVLIDGSHEAVKTISALLNASGKEIARDALAQARKNTLKNVGLAMHNYHDNYNSFPPAVFRDKSNKPLLSWRVHLLPYLDAAPLYKEFHLDEPWDSDHNKALIAKMPAAFAPSNPTLQAEGKTTVVVPVGGKSIFEPEKAHQIRDVTDGTSNTVLVLDVDDKQAVIWTKPDDIAVDVDDLKALLFGKVRQSIYCVIADGSVRMLSRELAEAALRALFTRNGADR